MTADRVLELKTKSLLGELTDDEADELAEITREEDLRLARDCYRVMHDGRYSAHNQYIAEKTLSELSDKHGFIVRDLIRRAQ